MKQESIDFTPPLEPAPQFRGEDFDPKLDKERLTKQQARVMAVMIDGGWLTLGEIAAECSLRWPDSGFPEASVSARLRSARTIGYLVDRRRRGDGKRGLFEYRMTP